MCGGLECCLPVCLCGGLECCLPVCLCGGLECCLPVCLSVWWFRVLSACLSVWWFRVLSACLFVFQSIYLQYRSPVPFSLSPSPSLNQYICFHTWSNSFEYPPLSLPTCFQVEYRCFPFPSCFRSNPSRLLLVLHTDMGVDLHCQSGGVPDGKKLPISDNQLQGSGRV